MGTKFTYVIPKDIFNGRRAITTQSYTEANVKLGVQFEASKLWPAIAAGGVTYSIFKTGAKPVSLKARNLAFTGDGIKSDIFANPVYSGGTPDFVYYNSSDISDLVGEVDITISPTVTDEGTQVFASSYALGNTSKQGRGASGIAVGAESILKPNTEYLLKLTSLGGDAQDISSFLYWYEGDLDLPLDKGDF